MNKEENKNYLNKFLQRPFKNKYKVTGFTVIPNQVFFDDRLGRSELMIFWVLTLHLFRGKKYVFPSVRTIQKEARISRPTVIKGLKNLELCGYLSIEKIAGKTSHYYLKVSI
mgnify:CR=1 FL=1